MKCRNLKSALPRWVTVCFAWALALAISPDARAQCQQWKQGFDYNGTNGVVRCFATFDDGTGPHLFASGNFTKAGVATANHIAKWDGEKWSPIAPGVGIPSYANALITFDDGSGPALYIGGGVGAPSIGRWNGSTLSYLGTGLNNANFALTIHDDGSGPALFVGGVFTTAGGQSANRIAKWNGTSWSALGTGMGDGAVYALASFDDGSGARLYAGGTFTIAGGGSANHIAAWDGATWSEVGGGTDNDVFAMTVHDDGSGPALFLGGSFTQAGGQSANAVAKWNGTSWSSLGVGANDKLTSLAVYDDGSGPALFAGGPFTSMGGTAALRVAKWDGSNWSTLGVGRNETVIALGVFDDGAGPALFVGGGFADNAFSGGGEYVAKWRDSEWLGVGDGISSVSANSGATCFQEFDDGTGPALFVGGTWDRGVGALHAPKIARWNGTQWSALSSALSYGFGGVRALSVFDDGTGPALYAGGSLILTSPQATHVARWNGSSWESLGGAALGEVYSLATFDDGSGPALFAAGDDLGVPMMGDNSVQMAKWNGTSWTYMTIGQPFAAETVRALLVFDDGSGPELFATGRFASLGGVAANSIAKWNGSTWTPLGSGITASGGGLAYGLAMAAFDDGTGSALYVGGTFAVAGGVSATGIAKWNGSTWSAVGSGTNGFVNAFQVFDDGSGSALYAGGSFTTVDGGTSANRVARWDGISWSTLTTGFDASVFGFGVFDNGDGSDLFIGGEFTTAGGVASSRIAVWEGCGPGQPYCFGDGLDPVVTAVCPCANFGAAGHGCANSFSQAGGLLAATGTTQPNTIVLTASNLPNNNLTVGFRNTNNAAPGGAVFGDGIRCQTGTLIRFGAHNSGSAGDATHTWTSSAASVAAGQTRYYQIQYRNPTQAFCPPGSFNITNGFRIAW